VNGFTFSGRTFYLKLAKDESENPEEAEEHKRTRERDPAARTQLHEAFEEIEVEREHSAVGVRLEKVAAREVDERRQHQQAEKQRQRERHRFEFESRQREVVGVRASEPVEQSAIAPVVPPAGGKARA
jgi:hypothetical protein